MAKKKAKTKAEKDPETTEEDPPESGASTEEDASEVAAREANPELADAQERADDLEAQLTEVKSELEQLRAKRLEVSKEEANAELLEHVQRLEEQVEERDAMLEEVNQPLTKETVQAALNEHPDWMPGEKTRMGLAELCRQVIEIQAELNDGMLQIAQGPMKKMDRLKHEIRVGGLQADEDPAPVERARA